MDIPEAIGDFLGGGGVQNRYMGFFSLSISLGMNLTLNTDITMIYGFVWAFGGKKIFGQLSMTKKPFSFVSSFCIPVKLFNPH